MKKIRQMRKLDFLLCAFYNVGSDGKVTSTGETLHRVKKVNSSRENREYRKNDIILNPYLNLLQYVVYSAYSDVF